MKIFFIPKLRVSLNIPCLKDMRKRCFHIQLVGKETHTTFWKMVQKYLLNCKAHASEDPAIPLYLPLKKCINKLKMDKRLKDKL